MREQSEVMEKYKSVYTYDSQQVEQFFDSICLFHDKQLNPLLNKEMSVVVELCVRHIKSLRPSRSCIADLGVGTGRIIRQILSYLEAGDSLDVIDLSSNMLSVCGDYLNTVPLACSINFVNSDHCSFLKACRNRRKDFDLILYNLAACTSNRSLDWATVRNCISKNGLVIFSDIHPDRIQISPFYEVYNDKSDVLHRLKLINYTLSQLHQSINVAKLSVISEEIINDENDMPYALAMAIGRKSDK